MDPSPMEGSKAAFKKKLANNFADNGPMTSSVKPPAPSLIPQEKYIDLEKDFKKLKKLYIELLDKYNKMKNNSIVEKVNIQMALHEAQQNLKVVTEENAMLKNRIDFLEKESTSEMRNYQRPLNRSMLRSITPGKKSRFQKENATSMMNLQNENDSFGISEKPSKPKIKTERSLQDDASQNQTDQFYFSSNTDSIHEIKFNPNSKKRSPLIKENDQNQGNFCGNQRCIKHYNDLRQMKEATLKYGHQMEELYMQLNFVFDKETGLKDLADYKQEILKLCKEHLERCYFTKIQPKFMLRFLQDKVKLIMNGPKQRTKNPQIELLKEKISHIMKNKEEMQENGQNEPFNCQAGQKDIERVEKSQKQLFEKIRKTLGLEEEWRQSEENSTVKKD